MLQESTALLRYSQTHELEMASQRNGAETMHNSIVRRQREELDELVRHERDQVRVLREEASNISAHLVTQPAEERSKCHELEMMAEFQVKTTNLEYIGEMQKLCGARDALAVELNQVTAALARCQQELALREVMLKQGDAGSSADKNSGP